MLIKTSPTPIASSDQSKDSLLKDFTPGQRDYIIHKLYHIIKKTLVHFVAEATLQNEIVERKEEPPQMLPPTPASAGLTKANHQSHKSQQFQQERSRNSENKSNLSITTTSQKKPKIIKPTAATPVQESKRSKAFASSLKQPQPKRALIVKTKKSDLSATLVQQSSTSNNTMTNSVLTPRA